MVNRDDERPTVSRYYTIPLTSTTGKVDLRATLANLLKRKFYTTDTPINTCSVKFYIANSYENYNICTVTATGRVYKGDEVGGVWPDKNGNIVRTIEFYNSVEDRAIDFIPSGNMFDCSTTFRNEFTIQKFNFRGTWLKTLFITWEKMPIRTERVPETPQF